MQCDWPLCSQSPFCPPPPPSLFPVSLACSKHAMTVPHLDRRGRGGRNGGLDRWWEDWEIKNSLISILVELQTQAAAGSCSPATTRKGMKSVMWQIDSRHSVFLSALVQRVVLLREARCFSERLPATFHAIILGIHIVMAMPSHYFQHCIIPVWVDMLSYSLGSVRWLASL